MTIYDKLPIICRGSIQLFPFPECSGCSVELEGSVLFGENSAIYKKAEIAQKTGSDLQLL